MKSNKLKRKLIFYSGGNHNWGNERLHEAMIYTCKRRPRSMTYIPSTHENAEKFFKRAKERYKKFGIQKLVYFPVDAVFTKAEMRDALKSDVIYLAGGNTFYFMKHLRSSGFADELMKYVKRGGTLAGLSAGGLIMTPDIWLAGYPPHDADLNEVRLKDLRGLNLVNFEFYPHYTSSAKTNKLMQMYSRKTDIPIMACPDGSGIVVNGDEVTFFGPMYIFHAGKRTRIA